MQANQFVRRLIWLYFFLWIFEGALRFWILPGLSNPLLIVRDPVVILIYLVALSARCIPMNSIVLGSVLMAGVSLLLAMWVGHGNMAVALFGVRAAFLHIPLIYVIERVWRDRDMWQLGKVVLWLSVPLAFLVVYQFRSPAGSWINQGGMATHYSTVRPAGTFSFVSGMVSFASLVTVFLAYSFTSTMHFSWVRSIAATVSALAMVAVSNSRSMAFSVGIIFSIMVGLAVFRGKRIGDLLMLCIVVGLAASTLSSTEFFEEGATSLKRRFVEASAGSGIIEGAWNRTLGMFLGGLTISGTTELFGFGIGYGTNVGAQLLTGRRFFLSGETEWIRVIEELGPILGWSFLAMRIAIAWQMLRGGMRAFRQGNLLPMLLVGAGAFSVIVGQWSVPSIQGFACLVAGLCLAAVKMGAPDSNPSRRSSEGRTLATAPHPLLKYPVD